MGKELSLGDLSKNLKANSSNNSVAVEAHASSQNVSSMRPIGTSELGKMLEKEHPQEVAAKEESKKEVTPELVESAFSSLNSTIEEKKQNADKMVEAVSRAVEEQALDSDIKNIKAGNEIEEEEKTTQPTDTASLIDELSNIDLDDMDDKETEEPVEEKTETNFRTVSEPEDEVEEAVEDKKADEWHKVKKEEAPTANVVVSNDKSDIDNLLDEIGTDDEDDTEDEFNIVETEETPEEARNRVKKSLKGIVITKDPIDLSKFTISDKPISASVVMNFPGGDNVKRVDFPLFHSNKNVTHSPSTGVELDNLRKTIANSNGVNAVVASLRFIWKHIVDGNKPEFETWCKSIRTEDIESLYYGHYLACYSDVNVVAVDCQNEKCGKSSVMDIPLKDFIRFENDDVETKFNSLKNATTTSPESTVINATLMQISDDYVISIIDATLYSTFVQYASLDSAITDKYADILNGMAYVDKIFKINREDNTLRPIKYNVYKNNVNKTVLAKLKVYAKVLKTLNTDQYNILMGKLNNIITSPKVTFVRPECKCPVCGETIKEEPVQSMLNLLFTRAQLVQVKSL